MVSPRGQSSRLRIFPRLVGDDDDALGAFGRHLARDLRHRQAAVVGLAAGHRDGVVEQDLVGDVDARRDRGADRQVAGMVVGAVAEILEHVRALGERRLADPVRALAAHLGEARGRAVHPLRPCSGSRCRHRRACLPARRSRSCAGSRSRNRAMRTATSCGLGQHRAAPPSARATRAAISSLGRPAQQRARRCRWRCRWDRARP